MAHIRICSVEDCGKKLYSQSYCRLHYFRVKRGRDVNDGSCSIPACSKPCDSKGYCVDHAHRLRQYGDPLAGGINRGSRVRFFYEIILPCRSDECLIWPFKSRTSKGYPVMKLDGKQSLVHRLACEALRGPPPTPKHQAAHLCGNGHLGCTNPTHTDWKTSRDNCADKLIHGTHNRGERNATSRLTEVDIHKIRSLDGKMRKKDIAALFAVSASTICGIISRKRWAWLKDEGDENVSE